MAGKKGVKAAPAAASRAVALPDQVSNVDEDCDVGMGWERGVLNRA